MIKFNTEDIFLVTGASSGIGEDIALRLNQLGASIIATGRNKERLGEVKQKAQSPDNMHLEVADLTENISGLPEWIKSLRAKYGKLRGLVCSAGVTQICPLKVIEEDLSKELFDINYFCPIFLTKGFADRRNNIGQGSSILFIASTAGIRGGKSQTIYSGSKAALIASARIICIIRTIF
jgi:short-subunit dehydrogenase